MCGHVGVASKVAISKAMPLHKAFKEQLYLDAIRGWDATGICSVALGGSKVTRVRKKAVPAHDFLRQDATDAFLNSPSKLMIGHNRAATSGKVDDRSSHPFTHDHITLAHNGTLYSHHDLPRRRGMQEFAVDSEAICHALSTTDDTKAVLEQLDGAFALVWYDQRADTLNFARNEERPFYYATDTAGTELLWASDESLMECTLERKMNKVFTIKELSSGEHLSFDMNTVDFNTPDVHTFQPLPDYWNAGYYGSKYTYNNCLPAPTASTARMTKWGYKLNDLVTFIVTSITSTLSHDVKGTDEATGLTVVARSATGLAGVMLGDVVKGFISYMSVIDSGGSEAAPTIMLQTQGAFISNVVIDSDDKGNDDDMDTSDYNDVTNISYLLADGSIMYADQFKTLATQGCGWCGSTLTEGEAFDLVSVPEYNCLMHEQCALQCDVGEDS